MDCAPAKKLENLTQQGFKEFLHQQFQAVCFGHEEAMNVLGYVFVHCCITRRHVWISLDQVRYGEDVVEKIYASCWQACIAML